MQFKLQYAVGNRENELRFSGKHLALIHLAHACGIKQVEVWQCQKAFIIISLCRVTFSAESRYCGVVWWTCSEKKDITQVECVPIYITIKNSISNKSRSVAHAVAKQTALHHLIKRSISTAAWQHENMAGMQDDKAVWWKQSAVISMQHRPVLSSWTFAETLSPRAGDKLSVVNRAAEANLCPFFLFFFFFTQGDFSCVTRFASYAEVRSVQKNRSCI